MNQVNSARKSAFGHYRWVICALLFFTTTINYIDRQVIGLLKGTLQGQFHFDERGYAAIVFSFQMAYAIGLLISGWMMDKLGTRKGLALAIIVWSGAAMAHAFAHLFPGLFMPTILLTNPLDTAHPSAFAPSVVLLSGAVAGFAIVRFVLGLGEAGNFPAAIKTVAEWFPKKERALATGIFNSGSNVGALLTPLAVPWIVLNWGWQSAFLVTGALGFVWLLLWLLLYQPPETHPKVSPEELAYIRSDPAESEIKISWGSLLGHRQAWAFALGKFLTDPIWWLYLFWIPDFLGVNYKIDLKTMGPPLVAIYLAADIGSIGGGWLSSRLLRLGWSANRARKTAMFVCALAVVPMLATARVSSLWLSVALISLAAAAHQGWSANLFTIVSDMYPKRAVGSVVGLGGFAGAVGGMLVSLVVGAILQATGSYIPIFAIAAFAYLVALVVVHVLVPSLDPAKLD